MARPLSSWIRIVALALLPLAAALAHATTPMRVGLLADYAPYQLWPADAGPGGADLELLERVAPRLGWTILPVRYERADALLDLEAGHLDLAAALARTPAREPRFAWTGAYARVEQALVTRADSPSATLGPDLAGRTVAVVRDYASAEATARLFPQARLVPVDSIADGLAAVLDRSADGFIEALPATVDAIERRRLNGLAIARTLLLGVGDLHMAGPPVQAERIAALAAALDAVPAAERQAIVQRWSAQGGLVARSAAFAPTPAERELVARQAPLRAAVVPGQAPFVFVGEDGTPRGLSVELAASTLRRAGLAVASWQVLAGADALAALREGRIDLVVGLAEPAVRSVPAASFAGPYIEHPLVLVGRRGDSFWSLEQLAGRRVALPLLQLPATALRARHPAVEWVDCAAPPARAALLEDGRADALLADVIAAALLLADGTRPALQIVGAVGELRRERGFGLAPQVRELAPLVARALRAGADEELPALKQRWLGNPSPAAVARRTLWRALPWALAVLAALALAWAWHARRLGAEVRRTEAARAAAEHNAAATARFVAFLAHEVRNSLHAVIAGAELLRSARGASADIAASLQRSSRATLGLLNDLLDRERLAAGRLSLQLAAVRVAPMVAAVVDEMRPAAAARGMTIAWAPAAPLPVLQLDALRVQQILRNLVANAIKYAGGGGIEVQASADDDPALPGRSRLTLRVRDHGAGMSDAELAQAFEPFRVGEAGAAGGSGLGLALSRDLARRMGGTLELARADGGGLQATLQLPAERAPEPAAPDAGRPARHALVVEDAEVYALLVERALVQAGWSVVTAASVAQAREALRTRRFDLLLSDLHLADGGADEVLDAAQALGAPAAMRRVVMSAEVDDAVRRRLAARGVALLVTKSADVQLFVQQLLDHPALATAPAETWVSP